MNHKIYFIYIKIVLFFSCSVVSNPLKPHGLQHTRLPCPSLSSRVCSNSCPLNQWCHPTISSSVIPFSSCLQSFPTSGSFPMSWLLTSGGQSTGASAPVLPMNIQGWFPLGLTDLISLLSKGFSRVFSRTTVQKHQFFGSQPSLWSNSHIHTWLVETTALTIWAFVSKVMSLLPPFPLLFVMKWWDWIPWSWFFLILSFKLALRKLICLF